MGPGMQKGEQHMNVTTGRSPEGRHRARTKHGIPLALFALSIVSIAMVTGSLSAGGAQVKRSKNTQLTVASIASADWSVVNLATKKGFFKQHHVNLKFVPMNSLPQEIPLMVSGHLDLGYGGAIGALEGAARGFNLKVISALDRDVKRPQGTAAEIDVMKKSGIRSLKQLTGKTIGVNALGTPFEYWARAAIDKAGGNSADVHFIAIPFSAQAHALETGEVDALSTAQPSDSQALAHGAIDLGDPFMLETGSHDPVFTYWFATGSFAKSHRAVLERFAAAMREADTYANAHPAIARNFIVSTTKLSRSDVQRFVPLPYWNSKVVRSVLETDNRMLARYHVIPHQVNLRNFLSSVIP